MQKIEILWTKFEFSAYEIWLISVIRNSRTKNKTKQKMNFYRALYYHTQSWTWTPSWQYTDVRPSHISITSTRHLMMSDFMSQRSRWPLLVAIDKSERTQFKHHQLLLGISNFRDHIESKTCIFFFYVTSNTDIRTLATGYIHR